ncbi:MAG: hypothetical protein EA406_00570, partial [Rhodospirillales bacterium]
VKPTEETMKATPTALTTIFAALFLAGAVALGPTMVVASEEDERAGRGPGMEEERSPRDDMRRDDRMGPGMRDGERGPREGMMDRMSECPMMGPGMMGRMQQDGMTGQMPMQRMHERMMQGQMMPGMMARMGMHHGPGFGPGMIYGMPQVLPEVLSESDVRQFMERSLTWHGNPRLTLGSIEETDTGEVLVEIVTQDGSLVQKLAVDRRTGFMRQVD